MANYSIVSNARFTPFSFDEMVKPFQMYGEYYAQQEQLASSLAEQAAEWGQKANETTDPITYQKYKSFESDLNRQSDRLLRQGLTPGLRADLQKMRKRYATEINPIRDAYNWRLQQIQQQAEGRAKGVVYEGDAATTSLDDYIANPTLIYSSADSNAGYARVANAAQAIAKGLSEASISGKIDDYTKALLIRSGYDANDVTTSVNQAMADLQEVLSGNVSLDSRAGKIVQELLQNESRASGIGDWKSISAKQEYLSKVSPALYNLIGTSQTTPMEDVKARSDLQLSNTIAAQNNQARLSEQAADKARTFQASLYGATYDPKTGKISGVDMSKFHKTYDNSPGNKNSKTSNSSTEYSYDRSDTAYHEGQPVSVIRSKDTNEILIDGKAQKKLADLTVKFSRTNPNDVEFWYEGKKVASFNTARPNGTDGVWYLDENNRPKAAHGDDTMEGIFEDVSAKDVRLMADAIVKNKGSENQYDYGITEEGVLYSVQNQAQRVTKGLNDSATMLQSLWDDIGYNTEANSSTYGQDADLNLW